LFLYITGQRINGDLPVNLPTWLRFSTSRFQRARSRSRNQRERSRRLATGPLRLEPLEDRTLLSAGWAISNGGAGAFGTFQEISAPDAAGNEYVTGYFSGTATFGSTTLNAATESSYVAKVDTKGNFLWATQIGGSAATPAIPAIAVDGSGNVYVAGNFAGTASFGSTTLTSAGGSDIYICKLDPNGNVLWARQAGGTAGDDPAAIAVDPSGNVFVSGMFDEGGSATVTATFGSTSLTAQCSNLQGVAPLFLTKLDTNGNFLWAEQLLGGNDGNTSGMVGDSSGNMYLGGGGSFQGSSNSCWIEKVDPNGNVVWAQGTSRPMFADAVFQDPTTGATSLYASIWPSASLPTDIEKLDASSGAVLWSEAVGAPTNSVGGTGVRGRAVAVDASGNVYVAGQFSGTGDFDPGSGTAGLSSNGAVILYKLDPSGNFLFAQSMGGIIASSLALDSSGNIYTAGSFQGTGTFDTGSQMVSLTSPGSPSLFLDKMTQDHGMIFGQVFSDLNNNGVLDAGESGIPNVFVYLDLNNSGSYVAGDPTATTDAQGYFHFSDVAPGTYTLRQIVPSGYTATPTSFTVSVTAGQATETTGFADYSPNKTRIYLNPTSLPTATVETSYSQTLTATGGTAPYTFAVTAGTLPTGLNLSSGGVLSGTPTALGSSTFTVTATDSSGLAGSQTYTLAAAYPALAVTGFLSPATAGTAGTFTVKITNADGTTDTGYTGTVHFTSSDPQAVLPSDYTFTAADQGEHTFTATLKTAGSQSITATDTANGSITGNQGFTVVPGAVTSLQFSNVPSSITAGTPTALTLTAKDGYGNLATNYRGTLALTCSDPKAILPATISFSSADAGQYTLTVIPETAGTQSVCATDSETSGLTATASGIVVNPGPAVRITIGGLPSLPALVTAGTPYTFTISVLDAFGNIATGYQGIVHFSSSDPQAVLPSDYTFTATDSGVHTFSATLTESSMGKDTIMQPSVDRPPR
jgi:hypothetical protein